MIVNSGYIVCHNNVLTYRHALFLLLLLGSKNFTEQQTKGDLYWQCLSYEQWLSNSNPPGCQWCTSKVEPVLKIKASANTNSVAWEGTCGYSPLGLIIKLLIWPLHTVISNRRAHHLFSWVSTMESDRGEKWVNAVLIHSRYTKRK